MEKVNDKLVVPLPYRRRTEAIDLADPDVPGEIKVDRNGRLLKTYLDFEGPLGSLIETYDNFILSSMERILAGRVINTEKGIIVARNPQLYKPMMTTSNGRTIKLTPKMARDNGYTYESQIYIDLILNEGTEREEKVRTELGRVPVMLGSVLCHLRGKSEQEKLEMGECIKDPLGYFIIKGTEKVVLMQEKLRVNRIFIFSSKNNVVCKMTCSTPSGSSNVTVVKEKGSNILGVHLPFMGRSDKQAGKIGNTVPVFHIFKLLGITDPQTMLGMVLLFVKDKNKRKVSVQLQPTILELTRIGDAIEYISENKGLGNLDYGIKKDMIMNHLKDELFTHISPKNIITKLYMLSIMIARYAEYMIGGRKLDDRDNWGNKRVESAGRSLEQLFSGIWKQMIMNINDSIDKNPSAGLKSIQRLIDTSLVTTSFVSSFSSNNWGVQGSYMAKENITDILKRESLLSVWVYLTRINTPTKRRAKQVKVRLVQMSQLGYVCPVQTPEGEQCGLVKNSALTNYVSIERNQIPVMKSIKSHIKMKRSEENVNPVMLNGVFLGWCNGEHLRKICVENRRSGFFPKDTAIVLSSDSFLYIYTDGARPTRPLLIVNSETGDLVIDEKDLWTANMDTLLKEKCVEYIDAFEQEYIQLAQTADDLKKRKAELDEANRSHKNAILELENAKSTLEKFLEAYPTGNEYQREEYENAVKFAKEKVTNSSNTLNTLINTSAYTHMEMDPTAIMGLAASLIPLANHNQAPRNVYQCSMGQQAMGIYHSLHSERFDTTSKCLAYPTRPLFATQMNKYLGIDDLPAGSMVIVAIMSYTGYNQEDAIIMNKASIDRGLFRQIVYKSYKSVQKRTSETSEEFARPEIRKDQEKKYAAINENGVPKIGSFVKEGDAIIGKVRRYNETGKLENASTYVGVGMEGIVDKVLVSTNQDGLRVVKVKIRQIRSPILGDKFASRHAQKATLGLILPEVDMPFTGNGVRPDIIINPHCIPSRMTIAKMIEIVASKISAFSGERINATAFRNFDIKEFKENLVQYGYNSSGKEVMYSGFTGEPFEAEMFIGPCYYQALKHQTLDKVQVRSRGAIKQLSHQPVGGRARGGGQRVGEMERDALISHGASRFLKERLCEVSDPYKTVYCYECGTIPIADHAADKFACRTCGDNAKFGTCEIPYSYKLLTHMLIGAGFHIKFGMKVKDEPLPRTELSYPQPLPSLDK